MWPPRSVCQKSPKKYIVIANQCRNTDVALSKDSLRSQTPDFSENYRQGAKAPLADQGELAKISDF